MDRGEGGCPGPPNSVEENLRACFVSEFCPVFSVVCYCTMPTFLFGVLLLVPPAMGVCQICFGQGATDGCGGSSNTCPWTTGISDNAAVVTAIVAGVVTKKVISIGKLLPQRFRKLFPRSVLDLISTIYHKPKNGAEFDPTGQPLKVLVREIKAGP